jgi:HPt (histidine-containing phosphotransfer) domain-containing protein/two-component sensor histidine kinase
VLTDDEQTVLKQKALELLRAERELFSLRSRHQQTVSWLRVLHSLPQLIDHRLPKLELYKRIGKSLITGLSVQRASFFRYQAGELKLLVGKGASDPVSIGAATRALLERAPAGLCNDPVDADSAELSQATGLHRFLFTRIPLEAGEELLLVIGFDRERAQFQSPFDEAHSTQFASLGQHIEILLRNANLVGELERDKERLQKFNEMLEHKVDERTSELARTNRDMRLVLDNVDHGFITLSPTGHMALERSLIVDAWFGAYRESMSLWQYLAPHSSAFASHLELAWDQLSMGFLPLETCMAQLPLRLSTAEKTFTFRYSPFFRDAQLEGVLVIVSDISGELAREREEAEQHELMQSFKRLMLDRAGFEDFMRETSTMIETLAPAITRGDRRALLRTIHTLKGNSATLGLSRIAELCHAIEERMKDGTEESTEKLIADLGQRWRAIATHVSQLIGMAKERVVEVPEWSYAAVVALLADGTNAARALEQILSWPLEPLSRPFQRLGEQAVALSRRAGLEVDVRVETGGVRVDPERYRPLFSELTHVVRNSVAHGFQPSEERSAQGKPLRNLFSLVAEIHGRMLSLEIADDGRGIDWQALKARARERGLPCETHAELVQSLFTDGVSTRVDADEMAGRGVGMAALKGCVEAMNGQIDVRSSQAGTSFRLTLPILHANDVRRTERSA